MVLVTRKTYERLNTNISKIKYVLLMFLCKKFSTTFFKYYHDKNSKYDVNKYSSFWRLKI